jgi:hypothetical protein
MYTYPKQSAEHEERLGNGKKKYCDSPVVGDIVEVVVEEIAHFKMLCVVHALGNCR